MSDARPDWSLRACTLLWRQQSRPPSFRLGRCWLCPIAFVWNPLCKPETKGEAHPDTRPVGARSGCRAGPQGPARGPSAYLQSDQRVWTGMTAAAFPLKTALQLAVCMGGIYGAYLTQGVVRRCVGFSGGRSGVGCPAHSAHGARTPPAGRALLAEAQAALAAGPGDSVHQEVWAAGGAVRPPVHPQCGAQGLGLGRGAGWLRSTALRAP